MFYLKKNVTKILVLNRDMSEFTDNLFVGLFFRRQLYPTSLAGLKCKINFKITHFIYVRVILWRPPRHPVSKFHSPVIDQYIMENNPPLTAPLTLKVAQIFSHSCTRSEGSFIIPEGGVFAGEIFWGEYI